MTIKRFAVFGHPIAHSVSPAMHKAAFRALGLTHVYEAVDVPDLQQLQAMVNSVREGFFAGANVTVPHKRAVLQMVDRVDPSAEVLGAANTLVRNRGRVIAYNTDAAGLADDLREQGAVGRTAAVIGAGGAAKAAVAACLAIGANVVGVTTRSWEGSETLVGSPSADEFRAMGALPCGWPIPRQDASASKLSAVMRLQWGDIAASADLVIQATSAGMKGAGDGGSLISIIPWERLRPSALLYDLVYNPKETPFLRAARERGLRHAGGLGMLARQGAHSLSLWLKVAPDVELMCLAAQRALSARER
ncbi:MAG TPA: shikimate dehydrogenase [Polyangiaceae bacterium]|nr:shikimate dehydrogenase [Polyangiaceae bacterium]